MKLIKFVFVAGVALALAGAVLFWMRGPEGRNVSGAMLRAAFFCWCGLIAVDWMGGMEEEAEKQTKLLEEIRDKLNGKS